MALGISSIRSLFTRPKNGHSKYQGPSRHAVKQLAQVARKFHEQGIHAVPRIIGRHLTIKVSPTALPQIQNQLHAWA